jgi:hypothetical protein
LWRWRTKQHQEKQHREMDEGHPLPAGHSTTMLTRNDRNEARTKGCRMTGEEDEPSAIPTVRPGGPTSSFWSTNNPLTVNLLPHGGRSHAGEDSLGTAEQLSTRRSMPPDNAPAAHSDGVQVSHR